MVVKQKKTSITYANNEAFIKFHWIDLRWKEGMMGKESSHMHLTHKKVENTCTECEDKSALHWGTETKLTWRGSLGLYGDSQRTATSLRMWPRGSGAAAPPWKSTKTDANSQSIRADNWTRWRRTSTSSQRRLQKGSATIKRWLQWQRTKANAWKQLLTLQRQLNRSIQKVIQAEGQEAFREKKAGEWVSTIKAYSFGLGVSQSSQNALRVLPVQLAG